MKRDSGKKLAQHNINIPVTGILEWFHLDDHEHVEKTVKALKELGVKHLRTGVSWADYHRQTGQAWYDWLIPYLSANFEILPCFHYTPPSISVAAKASSPPTNPKDYADFLDTFINRHGQHFEYVELWNEPNNRSEYDFLLDPSWDTFSEMIRMASYWAGQLGKKTVLGGMSPIDPNWLKMMAAKNALEYIDVIGIHGFPDVFDTHWTGWEKNCADINQVLNNAGLKKEIWITETGYSTWRYDEKKQIEQFLKALEAPVERIYWYSLYDLPLDTATVDGLHSDEREYHFGLIEARGMKKLLYRLWSGGGIDNVRKNNWMTSPVVNRTREEGKSILITGGAGFIGTNVADRLLNEGNRVIIYDNLSRPGVEDNLSWLRSQYPGKLDVIIGDVRDYFTLRNAVEQASHVFHFAAQVAVTSSLTDPVYDNEVNIKGTLNLLEAIRRSAHQPSLVYTSTNKVYGDLKDIDIRENTTRYYPADALLRDNGISESRPLDFHSPYGTSKGAADQYVLDYTRSFNLKNAVFRMSCIYGPHQHGTEDQGWVAHFILKALKKQQITLYGNGMQVRDILFVQDLVNAFMLAWKNINEISGKAFNIGGGPSNSVSLLELLKTLEELDKNPISVRFSEWRKGDQLYFVSDTSRFRSATGWKPAVFHEEGVRILYQWLKEYHHTRKRNQSLILTESN